MGKLNSGSEYSRVSSFNSSQTQDSIISGHVCCHTVASYRGSQVGWHKFATRIRACREYSIQSPYISKVCACANFRLKFVPTDLHASIYGKVNFILLLKSKV